MKKLLAMFVLSAIIFTMGLSISVFGVSSTGATINAVKGTVVIDGEIDANWLTAEQQSVALVDKEVIPSETKTTGMMRVMWDDSYFYVLVEVDKAGVNVFNGLVNENNDAVEIGYTDTGDFEGVDNVNNDATADAGCFRVDANGELSGFGGLYITLADSFKGSFKKVADDKYLVEMAIPWKNVTSAVGNLVSLEIQINDNAEGAGRTGLVTWANTPCMGWKDSSLHGQVTLAAAPAVETEAPVTETAAPDETAPVTAPATGDNGILMVIAVIAAIGCGIVVVKKTKADR
ncbi:MAG: sugar-binding protein [Eubacteriales bacterium]